mgnify:CR=1 FL=1|tara:strand:+ start:1456 stop:4407 length:2952 start_codon:yes stop_codon:yes gene_type:complete
MTKKKVRIYKAPNGKGEYKSKLKNFLYIAQQGTAVQGQQLSKSAENQLLQYITDSIELEGTEVEVIYQSLLEQGIAPQQAQFYIGVAMEDINLTKAKNKDDEETSQVDETAEMIQAQLDEEERLNEEAMDKAQTEELAKRLEEERQVAMQQETEMANELFFDDEEENVEQRPEGPLQEDGSFKLGGEKEYVKKGLKNFVYKPGGEEINNQTPGDVNQEVGKREIQRNNLVNYSQSNVAKKQEEERLKAEYANMIAAQEQQMYNPPMGEEIIDITNMQEGMEYARLGSAGSQRRMLRKAMKPVRKMMRRGMMPGVTHMDVRKSGIFGPKEYSLDFDPNVYAQMMAPYFTQLAGMMGGMSGGFPGFQSRKITKRYPIIDAAKTVNKENTKSDKELEEGYMSEDPMPMETKRNYLTRTGRGDQIKFFSEEDLESTWDDQYIDPTNRGDANADADGQTGQWVMREKELSEILSEPGAVDLPEGLTQEEVNQGAEEVLELMKDYQSQTGGFADSSNPDLTKFVYGGDEDMYKEGGFPDLTGDGKVTQADILKGRGVYEYGGEMEDIPMAQRGLFGRGIGNLFSNINPISRFAGYRPTSGYYNRGTGMPFAMPAGVNPYIKNVDVTKSNIFGRPKRYSITYGYGNNTGSAPRQEIKLNDSQDATVDATVDAPEEVDNRSRFEKRTDRLINRKQRRQDRREARKERREDRKDDRYNRRDERKYERNRRRSIRQGMGDPGSYADDQAVRLELERQEQEAIDNYTDPIIGAEEEATLLADPPASEFVDPMPDAQIIPEAMPTNPATEAQRNVTFTGTTIPQGSRRSDFTEGVNPSIYNMDNYQNRVYDYDASTPENPAPRLMGDDNITFSPTGTNRPTLQNRNPELQRFTNQRGAPSNITQMGLMEQGVNAAMDYYKNNPNMRPVPSNTTQLGLIEQGINAAQQFKKGEPLFATEQPDWAKAYGGPIVGDEVEMTEEELERFILGGGVVEYI